MVAYLKESVVEVAEGKLSKGVVSSYVLPRVEFPKVEATIEPDPVAAVQLVFRVNELFPDNVHPVEGKVALSNPSAMGSDCRGLTVTTT
jgi:hypothetical protein